MPNVSEEGDDTANQLYLAVGSAVVWTYRVTNTGTIPLQVTALVDNRGTAATADDFTPTAVLTGTRNVGDGNANGLLDVGEVWLYTSQGVVTYAVRGGQLLSGATVTGREPRLGTVVTSGDRNRNGMLDPGEIWLFSAIGTVPLGAYTNTATVSATVLGQPTPVEVSASDIAHLLGTLPGIHVDKYLNGVPSGSAASPVLVAAGSVGTYTYRVSATTPASLANVTVIDDNGTPAIATDDLHPRYVSGDANGNTLLDPDETWVFTAQRLTAYGPYVNVVQVTGDLTTHPGRTTVWDDDLNYSLGVTPRITLVKAVNALDPWRPTSIEDANTQPGKELLVGTTATWTYLLTNTGNAAVTVSSVRDDNGTPTNLADDFTPAQVTVSLRGVSYNAGDTNHNSLLDVGESWLFSATTTVRAGAYRNTATTGATQPMTGQTAMASDVAGYYGNTRGEGLTPGYWKNHLSSWPAWSDGTPVFSPTQLVRTVFTAATGPEGGQTLAFALDGGGGGVTALLRAAIAGLLATTSQYISYPVTARWGVDSVNAALASGDPAAMTQLQNRLDGCNNLEAILTPPPV